MGNVIQEEIDGEDTLGTIARSVRRVKWWVFSGLVMGIVSASVAVATKNRDLSDLKTRMDQSESATAARITDWVPWRNNVDRKMDRSDQNQQYMIDELHEIKQMVKELRQK